MPRGRAMLLQAGEYPPRSIRVGASRAQTGDGNHRRSVFRRYVGHALMEAGLVAAVPGWDSGATPCRGGNRGRDRPADALHARVLAPNRRRARPREPVRVCRTQFYRAPHIRHRHGVRTDGGGPHSPPPPANIEACSALIMRGTVPRHHRPIFSIQIIHSKVSWTSPI